MSRSLGSPHIRRPRPRNYSRALHKSADCRLRLGSCCHLRCPAPTPAWVRRPASRRGRHYRARRRTGSLLPTHTPQRRKSTPPEVLLEARTSLATPDPCGPPITLIPTPLGVSAGRTLPPRLCTANPVFRFGQDEHSAPRLAGPNSETRRSSRDSFSAQARVEARRNAKETQKLKG
jgi:hypothetical protein